MLHPSYTEMLQRINEEELRGDEPTIDSRYSIVIAAAKRAREIIAGAEPQVIPEKAEKPLSMAVRELYEGKVQIIQDDEAAEEVAEEVEESIEVSEEE